MKSILTSQVFNAHIFDEKYKRITSEGRGLVKDFVPVLFSAIMLENPGGTRGLGTGACEGWRGLSSSLVGIGCITVLSNSLVLFRSLLSSFESSSNSVKSNLSLDFSGFWFSWKALCCSFLIDSKEAERT
jgi:hypothetical protein